MAAAPPLLYRSRSAGEITRPTSRGRLAFEPKGFRFHLVFSRQFSFGSKPIVNVAAVLASALQVKFVSSSLDFFVRRKALVDFFQFSVVNHIFSPPSSVREPMK
ncbi:MAG: hypothetical protein WA581_20360 [Candidatus Acidiferrales bacterium]